MSSWLKKARLYFPEGTRLHVDLAYRTYWYAYASVVIGEDAFEFRISVSYQDLLDRGELYVKVLRHDTRSQLIIAEPTEEPQP